MSSDADYLRDLLSRLMLETRPYCRPSMVNYDVFPVFKEATDYMKNSTCIESFDCNAGDHSDACPCSSSVSVDHMLQRLWTMCVGTPGYDKDVWRSVKRQVEMAANGSDSDLLNAARAFFAWYNRTHPTQPSNNPDHPWCKLGSALAALDAAPAPRGE